MPRPGLPAGHEVLVPCGVSAKPRCRPASRYSSWPSLVRRPEATYSRVGPGEGACFVEHGGLVFNHTCPYPRRL